MPRPSWAWVACFCAARAPKSEIINDYGRDVANVFRVLQRHYLSFMEIIKFQITSRDTFARLVRTDPDTLTDFARAARFFYLQRTAFGGKPSGMSFRVAQDRLARRDITRLAGVVIECPPDEQFIPRYHRPEVRETFARFTIEALETSCTICSSPQTRRRGDHLKLTGQTCFSFKRRATVMRADASGGDI